MKKILNKIGSKERGFLKVIGNILRIPVKVSQWQLLKIHKKTEDFELVKTIQREKHTLMWPTETMQILFCAKAARKIDGDFAEVGVYLGGSAKLVAEVKGEKHLYLFDTFAGLPTTNEKDESSMSKNQYSAPYDLVSKYLQNYPRVFLHRGFFPRETSDFVKDKKFAFVHLDVDLYQSTLEGLEFFYPRMNKGGIILSHDYSSLKGVNLAFNEFFADKVEPIIELSTSQCLVVKV